MWCRIRGYRGPALGSRVVDWVHRSRAHTYWVLAVLPFYTSDLSTHSFLYPQGLQSPSPVDTERKLQLTIYKTIIFKNVGFYINWSDSGSAIHKRIFLFFSFLFSRGFYLLISTWTCDSRNNCTVVVIWLFVIVGIFSFLYPK